MAKKKENLVLADFGPKVISALGRERGEAAVQQARARYARLCAENAGDPKALKPHTEERIFPTIALHEALQAAGWSREESRKFLYDAWADLADRQVAPLRKIMKFPGLYRLMPAGWHVVTRLSYGEKAGFRFHFYKVGGKRVKFDMLRCPYCLTCEKYGCPELVTAFCHTDDISNENLHPRLVWNRSKTLGEGGDCCDFDVIVK